jgi:hypothetical protein
MQHHDGLELRRQWGEKPCNHESLESEFFDDTPTGDYLCKHCGKVFEAWEVNKKKLDEDE